MSSEQFYADLPPFRSFNTAAFDPGYYESLPPDWLLVVADIVQSTRAVESGQYTAVNYVGAACIVAVTNALPGLIFPHAFGGDGATLAIPGSARSATEQALRDTRHWAQVSFDLVLRVGFVEVSELLARGAPLQVAKLELSANNITAMFRGSGFDLADRLVKEGDGERSFQIEESDQKESEPNLESLSCRWAPMPSRNGFMVCLIIGVISDDIEQSDATYREVLDRISRITDASALSTNPVQLPNLGFRLRLDGIVKEAKTRAGATWVNLLPVALWHLCIWVLLRWRLRVGEFEPDVYRQELAVNADYRKVNGMLKLVLDCTRADADSIEAYLESRYRGGELVYGVHRASHAIMTCVAPNINNHEHVHYIDGSDGGLWSAAKGLKVRLREA